MGKDAATSTSRSGPGDQARVRVLPFAAVLLAVASVLDPWSRNVHQATVGDTVPVLAGTVGLALLVWGIAVAWRGRADAGAALVACVWVTGSLFYLGLVRPLNRALEGGYELTRPLPFALAAMVLLTLALRGNRGWHRPVATVVTCIALALVAKPVWLAATFEWEHGPARQAYDGAAAMAAMPELATAPSPDAPPDIYHFVFDRYGSEETLERVFGVTEPVGGFLEAQGFYVARDSFSNYLSTGHSLASTFSMDYLTDLADDPRVYGKNWQPIFEVVDDNRLGRFLRDRGYQQHQFGSWWNGTYHNPNVATNRPLGFSEFEMTYLRRTLLQPIFHLLPDRPLTMRLDWDNGQCQRVARQVEEIKAIARGDGSGGAGSVADGSGADGPREGGPVHVFAHILVPHGPYVFGPDGSCLDRAASEARGEIRGYAEQVAYADAIIADLVTTILAPGRPPAVIVIQADEGPIPQRDMSVPWQDASDADLRVKFGILNAFYFPGGDYSRLRQDMSSVNTFRAVLGTVFGADLPDLPDRMYTFPDHTDIYGFVDVTDRVRCAAPHIPGTDLPGPDRFRHCLGQI